MEEKPLTFSQLEEKFVSKREFNDFKNESLGNQDKIFGKLDIF